MANKPTMPETIAGQMQDRLDQIGMNPAPFEQLIRAKGIRMIHQKPLPCPNQNTLDGGDHDPNCGLCYNGYIYYSDTPFIGVFMGNSANRQYGMNGTWDLDQAQIVVPAYDLQGSPMDFQYADQILIPDFSVRYFQKVEANQSGIDRLHFAATKIDKILASDGTEYFPGRDCIVDELGRVKWISQNRPGYQLDLDRGQIYSINYYTKPSFSIVSLPHQLRVTQMKDAGGKSVETRYPSTVIARKNFIPHQPSDRNDDGAPPPRDGQL